VTLAALVVTFAPLVAGVLLAMLAVRRFR